MFQPATYVTIWDAVTSVRTNCEIDLNQEFPIVRNIEMFDEVEGLSDLNEEYVELNGEKILNFYNLDMNVVIEDGQAIELEDIKSDSPYYLILTDKQD